MTKEELNKEINKRFGKLFSKEQLENLNGMQPYPRNEELEDYIFNSIIPEVLKSITPYEKETGKPAGVFGRYLKGKVKKLYGIDL